MGAPAARGQGAAASPGQCSPSMSVLGFPRPVSSPYLHHTHTGTPMCTCAPTPTFSHACKLRQALVHTHPFAELSAAQGPYRGGGGS